MHFYSRFKTYSILLTITLIGLILRLHNISAFKIYPDSYLQLVMTSHIREYGDVIGWLGDKGMLYPDFIAWTRPLFPLLLSLLTVFYPDVTRAGYILSVTAGLLAHSDEDIRDASGFKSAKSRHDKV